MRLYRISFVAGLAAGFVAGTRAGRERYDQMVKFVQQAREHPAVQQATTSATNQASSLLSAAGQKVADNGPKFASTAIQKAGDHIPLLKHRDGQGSSPGNGGETGKSSDTAKSGDTGKSDETGKSRSYASSGGNSSQRTGGNSNPGQPKSS